MPWFMKEDDPRIALRLGDNIGRYQEAQNDQQAFARAAEMSYRFQQQAAENERRWAELGLRQQHEQNAVNAAAAKLNMRGDEIALLDQFRRWREEQINARNREGNATRRDIAGNNLDQREAEHEFSMAKFLAEFGRGGDDREQKQQNWERDYDLKRRRIEADERIYQDKQKKSQQDLIAKGDLEEADNYGKSLVRRAKAAVEELEDQLRHLYEDGKRTGANIDPHLVRVRKDLADAKRKVVEAEDAADGIKSKIRGDQRRRQSGSSSGGEEFPTDLAQYVAGRDAPSAKAVTPVPQRQMLRVDGMQNATLAQKKGFLAQATALALQQEGMSADEFLRQKIIRDQGGTPSDASLRVQQHVDLILNYNHLESRKVE
jgi:hypothetical protein